MNIQLWPVLLYYAVQEFVITVLIINFAGLVGLIFQPAGSRRILSWQFTKEYTLPLITTVVFLVSWRAFEKQIFQQIVTRNSISMLMLIVSLELLLIVLWIPAIKKLFKLIKYD